MTSDTMRAIDRLLGPPVCFLVGLVFRFVRIFRPHADGPVRQAAAILLVKPAEMGSTVLTYPALLKARSYWPDCRFYFLVFAENRAAVELLDLVRKEDILTIRSDTFLHFAVDAVGCILRLRSLKLDIAIDLEFFSRAAALLTACSGARSSAGFERYTMEGLYKGHFVTHPVQYNAHIHTAASFITLVDSLVRPSGERPLTKVAVAGAEQIALPPVAPSAEEKAEVAGILGQTNPRVTPASHLVILNVNSSDLMPLRRWPLENFIELGRRMLASPSVFIVLTGVKSEQEESWRVSGELGETRCVNLVGKTTLRQLLVLYSMSTLLVTNDSGPSHFGCLTRLPTVTLFGPETPEIYGPVGPNKRAITAGLACSPCVSAFNHRKSICRDNVCMKSISVNQVLTACRDLLQQAGSGLSLGAFNA